MDRRLKRVFVIVLDSMGMGAMADAARFGDEGADTLGHISQTVEHFYIPNLASLGLANLKSLKQVQPQEHPLGYYAALNEKSNGKDTMTGHWEMMGIETFLTSSIISTVFPSSDLVTAILTESFPLSLDFELISSLV